MVMDIATATKMLRDLFYGKGVLPLFLLLSSCSSTCPEWQYQDTITRTPYFNSGRIFLPPSNPFRELGIEIDRGGNGAEMYLNVHSFNFPHDPENPLLSFVEVQVDDDCFSYETELLLGGQRMKLPAALFEKITLGLLNNQTVVIRSGQFESVILPNGFEKAFQKLNRIHIAPSEV
ncbi:hypothetical protein [Parachlamydia acanthamoebae]|uniref:hypothetical protein n=1 Tax=Parachlamydia acanthamoebae TaxID=83552 RepID=UPI001D052DFB|nr:hypothetical protein [Parachlamydia acanthamoebae]